MESAKPELPLLGQSVGPGAGRRFVSIGTKLGLAVVLVVTIASVLAFLHSTRRERDTLVEAKRQAADMVADLFAESLRAPLDFGDPDAVKAELDNLKQNRDVIYAGVWLTGKSEPLGSLGSPAQGEDAGSKATRTRVLPDLVEVARVIRGREGAELGHATVQLSLARENAAYLANRQHILWLCLAVALGTVGVLLTITRLQVVAPIDATLAAVRRLEKGERNVRVPLQHHDEIGRLARAVEAMGAAIGDREQRLAEAHRSLRELFDHMRQAILVFDQEGRVTGAASRQSSQLFRREHVEGAQVEKLLFPDGGPWDAELRAFQEWVALAFDTPLNAFDDVAPFAPPEVRLPTEEGELTLSLEFRPIGGSGRVERIMLLATDETEKAALQRTVIEQGESHARQMAAMQRLVSGGGRQFVAFLTGSRTRLARSLELAKTQNTVTSLADLNECFGLVHTLRGESRVFGLEELATQLERIETRLSKLRAEALASSSRSLDVSDAELAPMLEDTVRAVDEAERLFVEASPIGRAVLEQVTVRRPDLERLCQLAAKQGGEQARLADRLSARSLGELTEPFADKVVRWAESLNKRARLEIEQPHALLPKRLSEVMGGALTHLLRNAVAHGIQLPEEREREQKPEIGVIRVGAIGAPGELAERLFVEDDGAGVATNPLLSVAADRAKPLSNQDTPSGSFRAAKEQVENELSGRGMGLSAVVRELQAAGFTLTVRQVPGGGTRFEIGPLVPLGLGKEALS